MIKLYYKQGGKPPEMEPKMRSTATARVQSTGKVYVGTKVTSSRTEQWFEYRDENGNWKQTDGFVVVPDAA